MMKNLVVVGTVFLLSLSAYAQSWEHHFNEGKRLYNNGEYQTAYESFERAQALAPDASLLDTYMAQSAYRAGLFEEAAKAYQNANRKKSDTWSNYNEGNAHFKNNDFAKAIESYKEALRKDPTNDVARYNLTQAIEKLKEQQQQNQQNQNESQDQEDKPEEGKENPNNLDNPNQQDSQNQDSQNQEQPSQAKLGREQTDQLLESMNQADKKTQDKLKDKVKKASNIGKREKDW